MPDQIILNPLEANVTINAKVAVSKAMTKLTVTDAEAVDFVESGCAVLPYPGKAGAAAALTTALAGANNDLVYTARAIGFGGNSIRVTYVVAGLNTVLSVSVAGNDITVNVATDGAGAATSTATAVKGAVDGSAAATALVSVANAGADTGAGVVAALAFTNLSGGVTGFGDRRRTIARIIKYRSIPA